MSKFNTIQILGEDGLPHALHFVDGAYTVVSLSMEYAVAIGLCTDRVLVNKFGRNENVPNGSYEPVWGPSTALAGLDLDTYAAEVVSSSAADAFPAGAGARTIRIQGLEATTFAVKTLDVQLNGVGVVAIGNWARINRAYPLTHGGSGGIIGTGGVVGTVTIRKAGAGATVGLIQPSYNQTEIAIWTVPAGKRAVLSSWYAGSPESKSFNVQLLKRDYGDGGWRAQDTKSITQDTQTWPIEFAVEAKGDIMVIASGIGTTGIVDAGFKLTYEDVP